MAGVVGLAVAAAAVAVAVAVAVVQEALVACSRISRSRP